MKEENDSKLTRMANSFYTPVHDLADGLRQEGYDIAGRSKVRQKNPDPNMIGILKDRKPIEKSLFGIIKYNKMQRALHIGTIYLNDKEKGAVESKKWVMEVNKSKYKSKLTEFVQKLAASYNVEVEVVPDKKSPGRETYLSELY